MAVYSPGGRTEHRPLISEFCCSGRPELCVFYFIYTHFFCKLRNFFVNLFLDQVAYCLFFLLTSSNFLIHHIRCFLCSSFCPSTRTSFPFYCSTSSMRWWRHILPRTITLLLYIELLYFAGYLNTAPPFSPPSPQRTPYLTDRFISHK